MKKIKQHKRIDFYVEIKEARLYLVASESNPIRLKIDITSVWNFFKEVINLPPNDK
jgi:hypothetical protein